MLFIELFSSISNKLIVLRYINILYYMSCVLIPFYLMIPIINSNISIDHNLLILIISPLIYLYSIIWIRIILEICNQILMKYSSKGLLDLGNKSYERGKENDVNDLLNSEEISYDKFNTNGLNSNLL